MLYYLLYQKLFPVVRPFRLFGFVTFRTAFASLRSGDGKVAGGPRGLAKTHAVLPSLPEVVSSSPSVPPVRIRHLPDRLRQPQIGRWKGCWRTARSSQNSCCITFSTRSCFQ